MSRMPPRELNWPRLSMIGTRSKPASTRWEIRPVEGPDLAGGESQGGPLEHGGRDQGREQGRRGGRRRSTGAPAARPRRGLDAQRRDLDVGRAPVVEVDVPHGEVADHLLAGDRREVVAPGFGAALVGGHHQDRALQLALGGGEQEGAEAGRQAVHQDLLSAAEAVQNLPHRGGLGGRCGRRDQGRARRPCRRQEALGISLYVVENEGVAAGLGEMGPRRRNEKS